MKIGIEINHVIRNVNSQMLKYYVKDIDKSFDDTKVETNVVAFIDKLNFKTKKAKENFVYVDYPYEIFGCAQTSHRNTGTMLNKWLDEMENKGWNCEDVCLFSLKENALTIQSSYYFLSKIGCRVRNVFFPKNGVDMWEKCDVIITTDERIINNKPEGKKVVLILTKDTAHLSSKCDMVYSNFMDLLTDSTFLNLIKKDKNKVSWKKKIKNKIFKIFG
jgi:hypothetical protein